MTGIKSPFLAIISKNHKCMLKKTIEPMFNEEQDIYITTKCLHTEKKLHYNAENW